jgi:hypothetical protein
MRVLVVGASAPSSGPKALKRLLQTLDCPHFLRCHAYTSQDRQPVSTLLVQPILALYLGRGFYLKSADSTWTIGWRSGSGTMLPLSLGLGYVLLHEDWPPLNFFVSGEWMAYRDNAPIAPQMTVRFGLTIAFPQFRPW